MDAKLLSDFPEAYPEARIWEMIPGNTCQRGNEAGQRRKAVRGKLSS